MRSFGRWQPIEPEGSLNIEVSRGGEPRSDMRDTASISAWVDGQSAAPLERWLDRFLDRDGVPRRLPVADWAGVLERLDEAWKGRPEGWPESLDARIEGLLLALLRFARSDGSAVFGSTE